MRSWAAGLAFPLTVFLALAALTGWLRFLTDVPTTVSDSRFRHEPDYRIEDFRASQLSATGEAEYTLAATRLLHYPDNDETVVEAPRVTHQRADGLTVQASAERGSLNHTAEIIRLAGNVRLIKPAGETPETRFATDELTFIPGAGLATGPGPVTADDGRSRIAGVGFSADLNVRSFTLHSAVKGRFTLTDK
ncbi:MAG TPA: LPS export ABC transporter periplasmic protein LptC [Rhodocyclaceae bacterium]